jgi:hypothetical protein
MTLPITRLHQGIATGEMGFNCRFALQKSRTADVAKRFYGMESNGPRGSSDVRICRLGLCLDGGHERPDAHDVHHSGEIVGQYVQRHLRGNPRQCLHQEVCCPHPHLQRAEWMLDCFAPLAHLLRMLVEPALHRLDNMLVLPSGGQLLCAERGTREGGRLTKSRKPRTASRRWQYKRGKFR